MKKYILFAAMLVVALCAGAKDINAARAIVLNLTDGSQLYVNIHSGLAITFDGESNAIVKGVNDQGQPIELSTPLTDITSWALSEKPGPEITGINGPSVDLEPAVALDGMTLTGLTPGAEVKAVDTAGRTVAALRAGADGSVALPFSSLAPGIYVIATPKGALKVAIP